MRHDLTHNIGAVLLKEPVDAVHTTVASSILDTADFDSAEIVAVIGALTGVDASNYVTPVLQDSDTTAAINFADVNASFIIGGFSKIDAATEDSTIQRAGYIGAKRYIRVNFVYTGTTITAGIIGAIGLLGHPSESPVTSPAAVAAT